MKCSFCGKEIMKGTGKIFAKRDGSSFNYCSSKCEKNHRLKRNPGKLKWVRTAKKRKSEVK